MVEPWKHNLSDVWVRVLSVPIWFELELDKRQRRGDYCYLYNL